MSYFRVFVQDPISRQVGGSFVVIADSKAWVPIGERGQHFWVFKAGHTTVLTITSVMVARVEEGVLL